MKFTSISDDFFEKYSFDGDELLHNKDENRPYVIVIKLNYRGKKQDFAIPLRSKIKSHCSKEQYFSLPPNHTTGKGEIHGLHYIKMFPIDKQYLLKYHVDKDKFSVLIQNIILKKWNIIIKEAQKYLDKYVNGDIPTFASDIDGIYQKICCEQGIQEAKEQVAITTENLKTNRLT